MPKKGRGLERLIHLLETSSADKETMKIQSPMRLKDKETGRSREHDVGVTITYPTRSMVVAIECRDRSRKIGVPDVEAFKKKCDATGVDKGAMVSAKGFCETARTKARIYGIQCLDLKEVASFDWIKLGELEHTSTNVANVKFACFRVDETKPKPDKFTIHKPDGVELTLAELMPLTMAAVKQVVPAGTKTGRYPHAVMYQTPGFTIQDSATGEKIPIKSIGVEFEVDVVLTKEPIKLLSYSDKAQNKEISQVATVAVGGHGPFKGELTFIHKPGGGTQVLYTLKPPDAPKGGKQPKFPFIKDKRLPPT